MIQVVLQKFMSGLLGKLVVGSFAVLGSLRVGAGVYFWRETEKLERPQYTVLQKLPNNVEIRKYEPYLIAETTVEGSGFKQPTADGFRACAGYIFGKNKPRRGSGEEGEKMSMTAPVRVSGTGPSVDATETCDPKDKTKVSFVIGSKYSLRTAPKPMDSNVKIRKIPSHTLAVKTFSGPPPKDDRVMAERAKIDQSLSKAGITPQAKKGAQGETLVYGYHDPFITPNWLRRNEVAVLIEGST